MCKHYEVDENGDRWLVNRKDGTRTLAPYGQEIRHVYPKYKAPILLEEGGERSVRVCRWGFFPRFGREYQTNARDDGLLTKSLWKKATEQRRCLIAATGYYEPGPGPVGARGEVRFTVQGRQRFFIAGLWEDDPDGSGERAFTMVTTSPNPYAARFHDRMPVVLEDDAAFAWLGSKPLSPDTVHALTRPPPDALMEHTIIPAAPRVTGKVTRSQIEDAANQGELLL